MPSKNPSQRLADIIHNIDSIRAFTAGLEFQSFRADRKTVYAVVRALETISEAVAASSFLMTCVTGIRRSIGRQLPLPATCIDTSMKRWMKLCFGTHSNMACPRCEACPTRSSAARKQTYRRLTE